MTFTDPQGAETTLSDPLNAYTDLQLASSIAHILSAETKACGGLAKVPRVMMAGAAWLLLSPPHSAERFK